MTGFSRRGRPLAAVVLCICLLTGHLGAAAAADVGAEGDFIQRANRARADKGAGPLRSDGELTAVARRWSARMAQAQSLSHNPNLTSEVSQDWEKLAENVGAGPTVAEVHDAFMASSSHRSKILDPAFTAIGVGVTTDDKGRMWVTEIFMQLRSGSGANPPPTTAAPTTTAAPATAAPASPAPATAVPAPVTTARPRVQAPGPASSPATTPVARATAAPPPPPVPGPGPVAAAPVAPGPPSPRLVLVLEGLRSLDQGR